jgi:hypothetical protein
MAKQKMNKQEAKALLPVLEEFNKLSKSFIKLLSHKVEEKEKQVAKIKVMVTGMSVPKDRMNQSTISAMTVDINDTKVYKRGKGVFKQNMNWEDDLRQKRRGIIL